MSPRAPRAPHTAAAGLALLLAAGCGAQPATAPGATPTAVMPLPPALQGRWEPVSKALSGAGPLTLTAQTLTWSPCGPAARAATAQSGADGWLLTLPGQAACRLEGEPVTQLRATPNPRNACELELSVFSGAAQTPPAERLAWAVYTRMGCAPAGR
ncbi:hypothetical protein [Ottowia testudinis]|uniref:Uncharacterized protein n=1 Tax=Ottowia testudinis TaxID=2816950 RepID=A0A975CFK0_9BURK|nr:hypothetical protein [Ottowia testudinis]QTD45485.1 hypothetical protein J1M35_00720 [Ottowia testudinis]